MDRQTEIAAKKAKIAELKRLRQERERELSIKHNDASIPHSITISETAATLGHEVVDFDAKPPTAPEPATSSRVQTVKLTTVSAEIYKIDAPVRVSTATQTERDTYSNAQHEKAESEPIDETPTGSAEKIESEEEVWKFECSEPSSELVAFLQNSLHAISRAKRGEDPFPAWSDVRRKSARDTNQDSSLLLRRSLLVTPKSSITSLSSNITRGAVICLAWHDNYNLLAICRAGASSIEIWDTKSDKTLEEPEWTLSCPAEIYTCMFSRDENFRLFAATNCGQLIMWELGSSRVDVVPSSRSLINLQNHKSVLASLFFMEGVVTSHLVTLDIEGTALFWSQDLIARPVERLDLADGSNTEGLTAVRKTSSQNNSIARYTCAAADPEAEGHFVAGTMTGEIQRCKKADRYGSVTGIDSSLPPFPLPAYPLPVLHLVFRKPARDLVAGDALILASGGLDWCVNLWSVYSRDSPSYSKHPRLVRQIFLDDIVSGIQWCPGCASLLAVASGKRVLVWNFLISCEQPLCQITLDCAVAKLDWSKSSIIAVGLVDGLTQLLEVSSDIIGQAQAPSQWSATYKLLSL